ncbi:MAG: SH3 domain-containing protein [Pararhizobium sp.]
MKKLLRGTAFAVSMLTATAAFAAPALVTNDLNLRTGPGTGYARITAMPSGAIVDVRGCVRGYSWCRVNWHGYDGWASANYLAQRTGGRAYSNYGAEIGIPLIAGAVIGGALLAGDHDHWDHHHWHHRWHRDHWRGHDRHDHHWRHNDRHDGHHWSGHRGGGTPCGGHGRFHGSC